MSIKKFNDIFASEVAAINARRATNSRPTFELEEEDCQRDGTPVMRPKSGSNVIGLALSGGGIRSAAFCLGAMQSLDFRGLIEKLDYLSTVSGGGYIGTSMTAAMSAGTNGEFPFRSELRTSEVPGVQHIRDHSNYLFPQGTLNIFGNIAVYLRGIVANVLLLLPYLLLAAAFTILWIHHAPAVLKSSDTFSVTRDVLGALVVSLACWSLWRSTPRGRKITDIGIGARLFAILLVAVLVVAFLELQLWLLDRMMSPGGLGTWLNGGRAGISSSLKFIAGFGTVIGFLGRFLADILKRTAEKPGFAAFATRIAIKIMMYMAGATVPLLLWAAYLKLSLWGLEDGGKGVPAPPDWLNSMTHAMPFGGDVVSLYLVVGAVLMVVSWFLNANANSLHRLYRDRLSKAFLFDPNQRVAPRPWYSFARGTDAGKDMTKARADAVTDKKTAEASDRKQAEAHKSNPKAKTKTVSPSSDLKPLDTLLLSGLSTKLAPYHLINAALNIQASKFANRRGRNADFFIFSPQFTGSEATGYVDTKLMQDKMPGLTAGTAMAVSGAAASANMGSATIKALVPTLAILNIRLGYWLANPAKVAGVLKKSLMLQLFDKLYFLKELLGLLSEDSGTVYLTDGGHLENLGLYELLRRRCKLIIAIDGEADPDLNFGSLITLERYARIDFGLRIDLPWAAIHETSRKASADILANGGLSPDGTAKGPHCALGTIYYPRQKGQQDDTNSTGVLLYVKSSFTGDENDYVVDYKRRNPEFPHETTLDQLFTEEQFEAYRALGFHALDSAFKLVDKVAMRPEPAIWQGPNSSFPLEAKMHAIITGTYGVPELCVAKPDFPKPDFPKSGVPKPAD